MKIRNGFVSNSSSSSFVCEICNMKQTGWDISLEEVDMSCCENNHTFCNSHLLDPNNFDKLYDIFSDIDNLPSIDEVTKLVKDKKTIVSENTNLVFLKL